MPKLLIVKSRLPFPLESGTDAVTHGILTALRDTWEVTVLSAGGGAQVREGAEALRREGCRVFLTAPRRTLTERHPVLGKIWTNTARLVAGVPRSHWVDAWPDLGPTLEKLTRESTYDLAQLEYWTLGRYAASADCPVALLNHDVWYRTAEQLASLGRSLRQRVVWGIEARATRVHELRAQRGAAWRLYLTREDQELADADLGDGTRSAVLPIAFPYPPLDPQPDSNGAPKVVFMGALGALFNQDAAEHLVTAVWPHVQKRVPVAELVVAGPGAPDWLQAYGSRPGIRVPGFVRDLRELYGGMCVSVVPVRVGTGIKVKVAHALSFGVPVVGSAPSLAGYPTSEGLLRVDDPTAMADVIVRLLQDPEERRRRAQAASECYRRDLWVGAVGNRVDEFYHRLVREASI